MYIFSGTLSLCAPWRENTVLSILALAALVLVINVSSKNPLETFCTACGACRCCLEKVEGSRGARLLPLLGQSRKGWATVSPTALSLFGCGGGGAAWWDVSPAIRHGFKLHRDLPEEQLRAWVLFFISLHDYGKFRRPGSSCA